MKEKLKNIEKEQNIKIIYASYVGSKLYGTNDENSDTDIRYLYFDNLENVLYGEQRNYIRSSEITDGKNTKDDIDLDGWSLPYFFQLIEKSDTNAVDLLFSVFSESKIYAEENFENFIKENYKELINKNLRTFIGYANSQVRNFGIKGQRYDESLYFLTKFIKSNPEGKLSSIFPEMEEFIKKENMKHIKFIEAPGPNKENITYISILGKLFHGDVKINYFLKRVENIVNSFGKRTKKTSESKNKKDPKATYHALRVIKEAEDLLRNGFIQFPLPYADELKDIKQDNFNFEDVVEKVESVIENIDKMALFSNLPEQSNSKLMKSFVLKEFLKYN